MISVAGIIIAGIAASAVFSMFTAMARSMGMTTMSIEKTLGAMFGDSPGASVAGWVMHFMSGIVFALIYAIVFEFIGATDGWLIGAVIGLVHGLMIGAVVMPMMGAVHPGVRNGTITAPGFFAINAGSMTPMGLVVGHILFGTVLGGIYFLVA